MTFTIGGYTYYQQFRKCGKASCKCANGEPHGPYWYRRDLESGSVDYVGKSLPDDVAQAAANLAQSRPAIHTTIRRLRDEARSLEKLAAGKRLNPHDEANVNHLGFEHCLVYSGQRPTQDNDERSKDDTKQR